ncbi:MAG: hypothetical protein EZS28_000080 [Streblomastix strix]|uniref:Uncharacterized protein n=1 Tax=Streblomastix strix TaxID=222440 RepID=A0A5J4XBA0_9EUKA|nr:MAG: hypothetical protein EZS28_000080 [Streblomastix strix]
MNKTDSNFVGAEEFSTKLDFKANVADIIDIYSKTEDDTLLLLKADKVDIIDSYSKIEDDAFLLLNADKNLDLKLNIAEQIEAYTKTETDDKLNLRDNVADIVDSYLKIKDDALILLKVDKTDLTNYVDLTSAQTISRQKQFGVISVSCISKLSKNDASVLFAEGGNIQVSYLVAQLQLQEILDSATSKLKVYIFSTQEELNDWMTFQDNVAKLVIEDNLYIVDKEVTDYWWDGTDLKVLETDLPDMSNIITTLGVATAGGDAIKDQSIDKNTLILAHNTIFATTGNDHSIIEIKTFTSTIISKGIQYSGYDNNSVFLANGQAKAISDINASVDLSNYYNKTQTYSQTETNNLQNDKAIVEVSYTKDEDDAFLLLKADKTQLIDSYIKTQTDNLLKKKTNQSTTTTQYIDVENTFNANINATGFMKTNKVDTSVLLADGGDALVSSLGGVQVEDLTNLIVILKAQVVPQLHQHHHALYSITLATKRKTLTGVLSFRNIRVSTDSTEAIGTNDEIGLQFS